MTFAVISMILGGVLLLYAIMDTCLFILFGDKGDEEDEQDCRIEVKRGKW